MFFGALGWPPAGANILLALLALLVLLAGGRRAPPALAPLFFLKSHAVARNHNLWLKSQLEFLLNFYMLLQPKNRKYRKDQKGSKNQKTVWKRQARSHRLSFGSYGLKSLEANWLKASQLEAVRRVIIRDLRKIGHIWIRTFPHKPVGKKPTKTRMGKGKGSVQYWVCPILSGQILFEINGGISKEAAKQILERASQKLPVITQFVSFMSASLNPISSSPSFTGSSFGTWPDNMAS